jgi:hypothetical protein
MRENLQREGEEAREPAEEGERFFASEVHVSRRPSHIVPGNGTQFKPNIYSRQAPWYSHCYKNDVAALHGSGHNTDR